MQTDVICNTEGCKNIILWQNKKPSINKFVYYVASVLDEYGFRFDRASRPFLRSSARHVCPSVDDRPSVCPLVTLYLYLAYI